MVHKGKNSKLNFIKIKIFYLIFLNLLSLLLKPSIQSILENIPYTFDNIVYSVAVLWNVIKMYVRLLDILVYSCSGLQFLNKYKLKKSPFIIVELSISPFNSVHFVNSFYLGTCKLGMYIHISSLYFSIILLILSMLII